MSTEYGVIKISMLPVLSMEHRVLKRHDIRSFCPFNNHKIILPYHI